MVVRARSSSLNFPLVVGCPVPLFFNTSMNVLENGMPRVSNPSGAAQTRRSSAVAVGDEEGCPPVAVVGVLVTDARLGEVAVLTPPSPLLHAARIKTDGSR